MATQRQVPNLTTNWPGWIAYLRATELLSLEIPFVLAEDYNVAPTELDVYDPKALANDALGRPESKDRLQALKNLGLVDAFGCYTPTPSLTAIGTTKPAPTKRITAGGLIF